MAVFKYESSGKNGKSAGILTANDRKEAEQMLRQSGKTILHLTQVSQAVEDSPWFNLKERPPWEKTVASLWVTKAQTEIFLRQLNAMLAGGVPILSALQTLAGQNRYFLARALFCAANKLKAGRSLSDAFSTELPFLGKIIIGMIAAGELNGDIDRMCDYGAELIADSRALRYKIIQALAYPCIVVLALIGVVTFLVYKVIPEIVSFLATKQGQLPPITLYLMNAIHFIQENGTLLLASPLILFALFWGLRLWTVSRPYIDQMLLSLPVFGKVLRAVSNVLFCRILGMLLRSGINIISAMEYAENAQPNKYYGNQLREIRDLIALGHPLSTGLRVSALRRFVPMAESMVVVGENTGRVDDGLLRVAAFCEEDLKRRIAFLSLMVEPALFLVVGGIVGFVYIAFFMALMSASQT